MAELLQVLDTDDVTLGCEATDMESAIRMVGAQLVERGAVDSEYIDGMLQREQTVSTYLGYLHYPIIHFEIRYFNR